MSASLDDVVKAVRDTLLPLNDNFNFYSEERTSETITAGEKRKIIKSGGERGWFIGLLCRCDSNLLRVVLRANTFNGMEEKEATASELYTRGLVNPNVYSFWLSRYDTGNDEYTIMYTPSPWLPYTKGYYVYVENTGSSSCTLHRFRVLRAKLAEET
ncbi:MAG: hypothetical protein JRD89_00710 [Deltaproteobacteria bacterium]|nr:hypothetical protein [Deltaproteobacteria bacterium]